MKTKLYVMADGLVLETKPTANQDGKVPTYKEIEVEQMPIVEEKELHTSALYYLKGKFVTKFTVDRNRIYAKINSVLSKKPIRPFDYKGRKLAESNYKIIMLLCDNFKLDVEHLLPYSREQIDAEIAESENARREIKELKNLLSDERNG